MRYYNVFEHPAEGFQAVKVGLAWPGLFFGIFWMIWKRLWRMVGVWFVAGLVVMPLGRVLASLAERHKDAEGGLSALIMVLTLAWIVGFALFVFLPLFLGNRWREGHQKRRGYARIDTVEAWTARKAIERVRTGAQESGGVGTVVRGGSV
jgi:hypothetical protein